MCTVISFVVVLFFKVVIHGFHHWVSLLASGGANGPLSLCGPSLRQHQYLRLNRCSVKHSQSHCWVPEHHLSCLFALCFCHSVEPLLILLCTRFGQRVFLIHLSTLIRWRPWSCLLSTHFKKKSCIIKMLPLNGTEEQYSYRERAEYP